jgi:hypothetical protein
MNDHVLIVTDHASSDQYLALRDFHKRNESITQGSGDNLDDQTNQHETLLNKIALLQQKSALKILYVIYDAFPDHLLTLQIADRADIHRSTVSVHVRDLVELGLVKQDVQAGTEKKYNPTYLFSLNPEIDREDLREIFDSKIKSDSSLAVIHKEKTVPPENAIDSEASILDLLDDSLDTSSNTLTDQTPTEADDQPPANISASSFEEQIATLVTKMAEEIVFLQNRVSELEQIITQRSQQKQQLDLSQAMSLLDLNKKKPIK